jgi:hypothetical protein
MLMFLFATSCYTLFVILNMKNENVYPIIVKSCIVFTLSRSNSLPLQPNSVKYGTEIREKQY